MTIETIIKNFSYRGQRFAIVKHEGFFCAVNRKYIDKDGMVTETLNGLQMCAAHTIGECIEHIKNNLDVDYYMENGLSRFQAMCKVFNIPATPEVEALFN